MAETWLVTGCNRGLGLELARQLVQREHQVIATVRDPDAAAELRLLPVRVETLDVGAAASVAALAGRLTGQPIDVLVNNAGVGGGGGRLGEVDWQRVTRVFEVNAVGPLRLTEALLPNLRAGRRKLVVNVTSRMGSIDDNTSGGYHAYRASKAALNMLNKCLAIDLGRDGFIAVVMHPGWVRTAMGGEGAPLSPEESVRGMLAVIEGLTRSDSGRFLDHAGATIPW